MHVPRYQRRAATRLGLHARQRLNERTTLTESAILALIDSRCCVPLGVQRPYVRVCLIYSEPDCRCFAVVQDYRSWKIVTVMPLRMWAKGAITENSDQAVLARDLALGIVQPETTSAPVDRRVRPFDPEQADVVTLTALERHQREAAARRQNDLARQDKDRDLAAFQKTLHTVPDRKTHRSRPPDFSRTEMEQYLGALRKYSGLQRWDRPPQFAVHLVTRTAGNAAAVAGVPKRLLREPLMSVIGNEDFRTSFARPWPNTA
ncbi:hypothetical protein IQ289_31530 [Burkholderia sp. R-70006]|uniref:hypothetical protein n=1 Tax=Paraburkholderia domus TaxID=2793075 RepID=UPI0019131847|nr:hypothetical protein [Paraburkholderia domus]MBK5052917.1 hypothetical protein [Burkholderia sp. R-70006]